MQIKKELTSGAMLEIQMASFLKSRILLKAVSKELKKVDLDLDLNTLVDLEVDGKMLSSLKNLILDALTSDDLKSALDGCFSKCLYDNKKINDDLFDFDIKAREDYFTVCWEVLVYNLRPFFSKIDLSSLTSRFQKSPTVIPTRK